jgi:hypothetical protein
MLLLLSLALAAVCRAAAPDAADFQVVSTALTPRVAFAVAPSATGITLIVDVGALQADGGGTSLTVGLAAAKACVLTEKDARVLRANGTARYTFTVPAAALTAKEADWARLRMGLAVAWAGGPFGTDRQRERFRHFGTGAAHGGLSLNPQDWMPLDLVEFQRTVSDTRNRIVIPFTQPMAGKATVVIEDTQGRRVRNLIAGKPLAAGTHSLAWDGLDDHGKVVLPGIYRWRSASHPGITPVHLFNFCADAGPNHSCLNTATANGALTFFGAPVTEGGYAILALDAAGTCVQHYAPVMGTGIERVALAAEGNYLYAAHDGVPWGKDRGPTLSITRFNIASGQTADYPGGKRYVVLQTWPKADPKGLALGGLTALRGKLYLADRVKDAIRVFDAATCAPAGEIVLPAPGALTTFGDAIYAVSGSRVVKIDPATQAVTLVVTDPALKPMGIALDAKGTLYVSDGASHTVRAYDAAGTFLRALGTPGGAYAGKYDPTRMVNPRGLAVAANGWLWVTEERWTPKRLMAWNPATGQVAAEHFGPTAYGAGGGGFDEADHTRWIGLGTQWKVDFAKKTATPVSILGSHWSPLHYRFLHRDGRTFLIGFEGFTSISELRPDGSVKDLAFIGSTHRFCFGQGWNPPKAFVEAFNAAYPGKVGKHGDKGPGVLWVDRSGDGEMQADEFTFSTAVDNFAGAYWGHDQRDLTLRLPVTVKDKRLIAVLTPDGYHPGGAPKYPALNDACKAGTPVALSTNEVETTVDRFNNLVVNSDPFMTSFAPDGTLRWSYPNRWTNVHGSHNAPLPEVGMMQGALFFLGTAPLDAQADVFIMNGNHGRFFALTTDGLYLDEMFKDVRLGGAWDAYMIGGECFGGFFAKGEDGKYYLQSGGIEYRLFRIDGLDAVKRGGGALTVTPAQIAAAERNLARTTATTAPPKTAVLPRGGAGEIRWDKSGQFPVRVTLGYDATTLKLSCDVDDPSPWVNGGTDWTLLFKTGDSVNLELGTDPHANPLRTSPVPGDVRLLIAPYNGKPTAVLYRYRVPGAARPVTFTSPWRSEIVGEVKQLPNAIITVKPRRGGYTLDAVVPLADLGFTPLPGTTLKADMGVLFGDPDGKATMLRSYWSNQATGLVNDVPGEIMLFPNLWGTLAVTGEEAN